MYAPPHFRVSELSRLHAFIESYGFATLVTPTDTEPLATHLPLRVHVGAGEYGTLVGHMARGNPHWRELESAAHSLAIFHGPHAYVSPTWYVTEPAVPTWNYAVVHATVRAALLDAERTSRVVDELVAQYESGRTKPWTGELPADFRSMMLRGIVAFELRVERIEGKFKLGQNRPRSDQESALAALSREPGHEAAALAAFWQRELLLEESQ